MHAIPRRAVAMVAAALVSLIPATVPALATPPSSPLDDIALVERMTPAAAKKADSTSKRGVGKIAGRALNVIPSPSSRGSREFTQGATRIIQTAGVNYVLQPREDSLQVTSLSRTRVDRQFSYRFPGMLLEPLEETGFVVVRDEETREPVAFIEPAWAKDGHGKPLSTSYSAQGDTLLQLVDIDAQTRLPVVADPRVRWTWYGASVDFSRSETSLMSIGFAACSTYLSRAPAGVPGAIALACGTLTIGAQAGMQTGRCLSLKWISSLGPAGVTWWLSPCYA